MSYHKEDSRDNNKEPSWDGTQATWADYTRRVRLAYDTTPSGKRKLLGPKLAMRLSGRAWEIIAHIDYEKLRKTSGAKYLLTYLRERLGRTPVPDAAQRLEDLFLKLRRVPGEGFAEWAVRVRESYKRVQRSLARARIEPESPKVIKYDNALRSPFKAIRTDSEPQGEPPSPSMVTSQAARGDAARTEVAQEQPTQPAGDSGSVLPEHESEHPGDDDWWASDQWWSGHRWHSDRRWRKNSDTTDEEDAIPDHQVWADLEAEDTEVLPSEVLGWLLLRRAGLSTAARLSVQGATQNSLKFEVVEKALRDQQEELLTAEYQQGRHTHQNKRSYWVETGDQWGLVLDNVIEDDAVNEDQVHWVNGNPFIQQNTAYAAENVDEDETWFDGTYMNGPTGWTVSGTPRWKMGPTSPLQR